MADAMLTELYKRCFETKAEAEYCNGQSGEANDRRRQVALAKNELLSDLISVRTEQLKRGGE
jgi:hypothetical protein